jgi:hypothetical protein
VIFLSDEIVEGGPSLVEHDFERASLPVVRMKMKLGSFAVWRPRIVCRSEESRSEQKCGLSAINKEVSSSKTVL